MSTSNLTTSRTVTRNITDLELSFFVRKELDQDWAIHLSLLLDAGQELEPILITQNDVVIDGRHRMEAHELAKKTEIKCRITEVENEVELIVLALRQNVGGSLPPGKADFEHTIQGLIDRGVSKKDLTQTLDFLPGKLVRRYLSDVESRISRAKLQRAATAVAEGGLTVPKAAEQYDVPETQLRTLMTSSVNRKSKRGVDESKKQLSMAYKSLSQKNGATFRRILEAYQDADVSVKQVMGLFSHVEQLAKNAARNMANVKKRFESMEAPRKIA